MGKGCFLLAYQKTQFTLFCMATNVFPVGFPGKNSLPYILKYISFTEKVNTFSGFSFFYYKISSFSTVRQRQRCRCSGAWGAGNKKRAILIG